VSSRLVRLQYAAARNSLNLLFTDRGENEILGKTSYLKDASRRRTYISYCYANWI